MTYIVYRSNKYYFQQKRNKDDKGDPTAPKEGKPKTQSTVDKDALGKLSPPKDQLRYTYSECSILAVFSVLPFLDP